MVEVNIFILFFVFIIQILFIFFKTGPNLTDIRECDSMSSIGNTITILMDAHELERFYYILMNQKQEEISNESE